MLLLPNSKWIASACPGVHQCLDKLLHSLKSLQGALREEPTRARLSYLIRQKAERDIAASGKASASEMLCSIHPPAPRLVLTAQREMIPGRERDLPGNPSSLQERMCDLKGSTCIQSQQPSRL